MKMIPSINNKYVGYSVLETDSLRFTDATIALIIPHVILFVNHSIDFVSRRLSTACVGVEGFEPPMS